VIESMSLFGPSRHTAPTRKLGRHAQHGRCGHRGAYPRLKTMEPGVSRRRRVMSTASIRPLAG
jgi:hypothetical protein